QLHPPGRLPARSDRARGLDRRSVSRAGEAPPRRARRTDRRRARRACAAAARPPAVGEAPLPLVRRPEGVLRVAGRGVSAVTVFLVGAGRGDPGLITARGLELIRGCDVLVHDRLVADELVAEAPADAIRIGRERLEQDEINRLLVLYGRRRLNVVRLKG